MNLINHTKKIIFLLFAIGFILTPLFSSANPGLLTPKETLLLKKNFFLLYLLDKEQSNISLEPLQQISLARNTKLNLALKNCETNNCLVNALQLSPTEITQIGELLVDYAVKSKTTILSQLKAEKAMVNFAQGGDAELIKKSWELSALAMNRILAVYINGEKPTYPKIDAGDFAPNDMNYYSKIKTMLQKIVSNSKKEEMPYHTLLLASIKVLMLNERDEAVRYEPLQAGWNKDATKQLAKTNWSKYPYSAILVPGLGPEEAGLRLDPNGAKRCDSAAKRYFAGMAPYIVVSGGHVHPNKTPFAEAVEMKKYLISVLKVPSQAILIEPHARHTTTNLRNMNRMIFRFGMPVNKKVLIVTDASQSSYILGNMGKKALGELGYVPYSELKKISNTETEYLPNELSLQANPIDPLDPQ